MLVAVQVSTLKSASADSVQADPDDVYYEIHGLVYMRPFSKEAGVGLEAAQKLADIGLKFRVIGSVMADPEQRAKDPAAVPTKTFYVVEFYTITKDSMASDARLSAVHVTKNDNGKLFAVAKDAFDTYVTQRYIRKLLLVSWRAVNLTYGAALSVPFKLRPRIEGHNRDIVTDVTLAGYVGVKWRMSAEKDYFVSLVGNAGLALVPINGDNNGMKESSAGSTTVPAITIAAGLIFQLDSFQLGVLTGRDYASGDLGNNWVYNTRQWYSFSLGFSFLGGSTETKK